MLLMEIFARNSTVFWRGLLYKYVLMIEEIITCSKKDTYTKRKTYSSLIALAFYATGQWSVFFSLCDIATAS